MKKFIMILAGLTMVGAVLVGVTNLNEVRQIEEDLKQVRSEVSDVTEKLGEAEDNRDDARETEGQAKDARNQASATIEGSSRR